MVRYRLPVPTKGAEYKAVSDKYAERHVRGLALLVAAEERVNNVEQMNPLEEVDTEDVSIEGEQVSNAEPTDSSVTNVVVNEIHPIGKRKRKQVDRYGF